MSANTRRYVLSSFRFKAEHLPSEFLYLGLIAYVLFTRSLGDLQAQALPYFLGLFAIYQAVGVIVQVSERRFPDIWDVAYWTGGTFIFTASIVLIVYGFAAVAIDGWAFLNRVWAKLDPLENQSQFMVATGLMTLAFGAVLFTFRLKQRFLYGCTEAGVGVLVGMHRVTLEQWSGLPRSSGFYLALLTAGMYLVVRGLDNIHQAKKDGDRTLKRFVGLLVRDRPVRSVRRLRSALVVPWRLRVRGNRSVSRTSSRIDRSGAAT